MNGIDELKQTILKKQIEREREEAETLMKHRKYMDSCIHLITLSSIFRRAAYLYPPGSAENLFSLASSYESLALNIRNKEKSEDLQKMVEIRNSLPDNLIFPEKPTETWEQIGGLEDAKMKIKNATDTAIFLYGPEGSGKRMLARAFAHEKGINFYEVNMHVILSKYFGEPREVIDVLFDKILKSPGSVAYINELDVFTKEKTSFTEAKGIMLYLMAKIEEVKKYREFGVFVFASAKEPWKMDTDIIEHFPTRVYVPIPDPASRALIIKLHLSGSDSTQINMEEFVRKTEGFSGKNISELCYKVLEKMLLEQNPDINQLNVRTLERNLSQRPIRDDDFTPFLEEIESKAVSTKEYEAWNREYG